MAFFLPLSSLQPGSHYAKRLYKTPFLAYIINLLTLHVARIAVGEIFYYAPQSLIITLFMTLSLLSRMFSTALPVSSSEK